MAGHVGDAVFVAGDELAADEMRVEHAEQALGFAPVALDRVWNRLWGIHAEMPVLPGHRPEPTDLPEQPLQRIGTAAQVARQELPVFSAR